MSSRNDTILIQNLPSDANEQDVRNFCEDCGVVNQLEMMPNQGSCRCQFSDPSEANNAVQQLDNQEC